MSWLFFMDESGHDHKNTPFEVRGGIALKDERIWPFIRQIKELEIALFGREMNNFGKEIKGERLLNRERYKIARKVTLDPSTRRALCNKLLDKSGKYPVGYELIAYHQTCIEFAQKIMQLLLDNKAVIFASLIPRGITKPVGSNNKDFLRKDLVFLFERYFYFLESVNEHGLLIMDETDKVEDINFLTRLQKYFTLTANGRYRSSRIIPVPLFVSSDMSYPVQAADVCIYCINWGFRLKYYHSTDYREEIAEEFGPSIARLQYKGSISVDDQQKDIYGIVYVPDPYTSRE